MTTSGTYAYAPNRAQVRQDALEMVGHDVQQSVEPAVAASADNSLNALIKALNVDKTDINVIVKSTLATVAGTPDYTLPTGTIGIDTVYVAANNSDYPVTAMTKAQYYAKNLKASAGRPTEFYHDRPAGKIYFYPAPDAAYTVTYGKISQYQDMTDDEQTFDFPSSAIEMLTFGLAHRLSIKRQFSVAERQALKVEFVEAERRYIVANSDYTKGQTSTSAMVV